MAETSETDRPSDGLAVLIRRNFSGATQPASIEAVADLYLQIAILIDAVTSSVSLLAAPAGDQVKHMHDIQGAISRLTENLRTGLMRLEVERRKGSSNG